MMGGGGGIGGMLGGMSGAFKQPDHIPFPSLFGGGMPGGQIVRGSTGATNAAGSGIAALLQALFAKPSHARNPATEGAFQAYRAGERAGFPTASGMSSMSTPQSNNQQQGIMQILQLLGMQAGG